MEPQDDHRTCLVSDTHTHTTRLCREVLVQSERNKHDVRDKRLSLAARLTATFTSERGTGHPQDFLARNKERLGLPT